MVPRNAAVNTRTLNTTLPTSGFPATLIAGGSSTDVMGGVGKHRQDSMVSSPFTAPAGVTKDGHRLDDGCKNDVLILRNVIPTPVKRARAVVSARVGRRDLVFIPNRPLLLFTLQNKNAPRGTRSKREM